MFPKCIIIDNVINIVNGTMDPILSVRLGRIKRSQVISLAKLGPTLPDFGPIIILATFFRQLVDRIGIRNWEIRDDKYELGKCCWPIAGKGIFHGKCNIQSELATSYILAEYISI